MQKKVTAIITTKNRALLLERALNSVLKQTYANIETIIVDDGSTDQTPQLIEDYVKQNPNIIYLRNEISRGACAARNRGIAKATGEFVTGLDDDDEWLLERIEKLLKNYSENFSFIASNDNFITSNGIENCRKKEIVTLDDILYKNHVGNQVLVLRDRITAINGFDENLVAAQDYDTWIRLIYKFGPAKIIQIPLQNVYADHEVARITVSGQQFKGYLHCYFKHKELRNRNHRKYQLFLLYKARNKKLNLLTMATLASSKAIYEIFMHYIMYSKTKFLIKELKEKCQLKTMNVFRFSRLSYTIYNLYLSLLNRGVKYYVFVATTGRSGSNSLTETLKILDNSCSQHEPYPIMLNSGVKTEYSKGISIFQKKIINIKRAASGKSYYVETNHLFVKNFAEQIIGLLPKRKIKIIALYRKPIEVAKSFYKINSIPGKSETGLEYLLDPSQNDNLIQLPELVSDPDFADDFYKCLWYVYEINKRIEKLRKNFPDIDFFNMKTEDLNSKEKTDELLKFLDASDDARDRLEIGIRTNLKVELKESNTEEKNWEQMHKKFVYLLESKNITDGNTHNVRQL
jgi:glycosyltransferase involved in cell wall biosynthesis